MLSSGAGGAEHLHLHVRRVELDVHRLHLGQHRHGGGGGVDPAAGLGLRHPLDPVDPAFKLEPGPGALPLYCKGDLLESRPVLFRSGCPPLSSSRLRSAYMEYIR